MFKIYIASILYTFSLVAMEKLAPQHRDNLESLQQPLEIDQRKEDEAIKIAFRIVRDLNLDDDKIKCFKDNMDLIKDIEKKNSMLSHASARTKRLLIPILIEHGAQPNINEIMFHSNDTETHDILRMLIKNIIITDNDIQNSTAEYILNNAINFDLIDVVENLIYKQKWHFTANNLNLAINNASSGKSSAIAILLLKNLSHLDRPLNNDDAAKYINFIINSDSPEDIDYILIQYQKQKINIIITDEITSSFVGNKISGEKNLEIANNKDFHTKIDKVFKAIILSLTKLLINNNIDDFSYISSFLTNPTDNIYKSKEFKELVEKAHSSTDKNFIFFLLMMLGDNVEEHINKLNYSSLTNKNNINDYSAGEKITAAYYNNEICPIDNYVHPQKIEKKLCTIFFNLNELLTGYSTGYRIKCNYKDNKVTIALNRAHDKILNLIYNTTTKHRFSATKYINKITINTPSKDIDDEILKIFNHDLIDKVSRYIKKQTSIMHNKDDDSSHHHEIITNAPLSPENPHKKDRNYKHKPTSWDGFIKEDHKLTKEPKKPRPPKNTAHNKVKNTKNNTHKKTLLPASPRAPLSSKIKNDKNNRNKTCEKFDNNYLLTSNEKNINPISYKSQFLTDNNNNVITANKDIINLPHNSFETFLSNYYIFFNRISGDKIKQIFNHGVMAIDLSRIGDENYINNMNDGLKNFNNDIIPDLNNVYNKFKQKYDVYLTENNDARIVEINHLLKWLQEGYQNLIVNEDAAKGYLFILGEHISRVMVNNKEKISAIIGDESLMIDIKNFRNAVKHGPDNKITNGEITYVIGKESISEGKEIIERLLKEI